MSQSVSYTVKFGVFAMAFLVAILALPGAANAANTTTSTTTRKSATTRTVTVKVTMNNTYSGATGWAQGSGVVGTKLSTKGTDGKSLADHVNDLITKQKKEGFVLAKKGTTWPGSNGIYPTKNTTYTLAFEPIGVPIYWLVQKKTGENLYTPSDNEAQTLKKRGKWDLKGIKWYAPKSGEPVYRLVNNNTGDHHYTKSLNERNTLIKRGKWKSDIGGKALFYSGGNIKVYRMRNDARQKAHMAGTHLFETRATGISYYKKFGWTNEGALLKAYANGSA